MQSPRESTIRPTSTPMTTAGDSLRSLRRFAQRPANVERCELCSAEIPADHPHLLNRAIRRIACSCPACAILFCGQEGAKFVRVPTRVLKLEDFRFSDDEWDALMLPIHLAFFVRGANGGTTALYPSPAGVMESMLGLPAWSELTRHDKSLASLAPDVEALLVNRVGACNSYFIIPIDIGFRLVGLIRTKWRGISGGPDVWRAVNEFFDGLEQQAITVREATHA